ncbi:MAG: hypothetical protein ACMUJM_13675 [bacterium]
MSLFTTGVHETRIQDRDEAKLVFMKIFGQFPRLTHIWADRGYSEKLITWAYLFGDWALKIIKRLGKGSMALILIFTI